MMRHLKLLGLGLVPILVTMAALAVLVTLRAPQSAQSGPEGTSACVPVLQKQVSPDTINLGQTAQVTLIMTHTCPAETKPIDLVFLADISNSMTRELGGGSDGPGPGPGPGETPPPGPGDPPPGPGDPPPGSGDDPSPGGGDDPPGCGTGGNDSNPGPPGPPEPPGPGGPIVPMLGALSGLLPNQPTVEPPKPPDPPGEPKETPTPKGGGDDDDSIEPGGDEDLVREVQKTIRDILDRPEIAQAEAEGRLRVGLASFNDRGKRVVKLTDNVANVRNRVSSLRGDGHSRIDLGLRIVDTMFTERDRFGRIVKDDDRIKVLVVMSDGLFCRRDFRPGAGNRSDQVEVVTMAAGRDADRRKLRQLASEREYALELNDIKEFMHLFTSVLPTYDAVGMETAEVRDELMPNIQLVPGSQDPPTMTVTGPLLSWTFAPPGDPITVTYQIEPQESGVLPVSYEALLAFTDTQALTGTMYYPDVSLIVNPPTATPTPTSTPTATSTSTPTNTPTPTPSPRYLPMLYSFWPEPTATATASPTATPCVPENQVVDIALVIDTSNSMSDPTSTGGLPKIQAAVGAGKALVDLLLPLDRASRVQVTVIGFNGQPTVATALTGDRAALMAALDSLPGTQAGGTYIGKGLTAGLAQLRATSRPGAKQAMIVLTDGEPADRDEALQTAGEFKATGHDLFAVGLGQLSQDASDFLNLVASPGKFVAAPQAEDLELIYREIGTVIPCP